MTDVTPAVEALKVHASTEKDVAWMRPVLDTLDTLVARIGELEGEYEALRETDLDHGLRLLRENTELRAERDAWAEAMERWAYLSLRARIAELEGERHQWAQVNDDLLKLEAENTELRAAVNPGGAMFDAMAQVLHERDELRAELERKRALVAALYDHVAATGSADGEPLRLLLADHVSAHPQETE